MIWTSSFYTLTCGSPFPIPHPPFQSKNESVFGRPSHALIRAIVHFLDLQGSFTCECSAPWWLEVNGSVPGVHCYPIGPCEKGTDTCGLNHTCASLSDLDFNCTCKNGFYGNQVRFPNRVFS